MADVKGNDLFDQKISMAGYGDNNHYHKGVSFEEECAGNQANLYWNGKIQNDRLSHNCTAVDGTSGSPIFLMCTEQNTWSPWLAHNHI